MIGQRLALTVGFLAGVPVLLLVVALVLLHTGLKVIWTDDIKSL